MTYNPNSVFVLNADKAPLMPTTPSRARRALRAGKAAVYRLAPFTIIRKVQIQNPVTQPTELRIDPGSKTTGLAVITTNKSAVLAANLTHRGDAIRAKLEKRRAQRRARRARKTRYRAARFNNRTRKPGWLPPSLQSRVDNVVAWTSLLANRIPLASIAIETVRFDTQAMQNPEISGVEYQQGTLLGYEVREYLLEKWQRACAYCDAKNVPLQIEHVDPRANGGSNRVSNLALACGPCNDAKGTLPIETFLAGDPARLKRILAHLKTPLRDAAAANATRYAIGNALKAFGLPTAFWSGGRTKMNRVAQGYAKDHWIDAACVGEDGARVYIDPKMRALAAKATGRGTRQTQRVNAYGFPRGAAKTARRRHGYSTGDVVRAFVTKGKAPGQHRGRIAATNARRFDVATSAGKIGTTARKLALVQRDFGYAVA